jgi:hypothetical protein
MIRKRAHDESLRRGSRLFGQTHREARAQFDGTTSRKHLEERAGITRIKLSVYRYLSE